MTNEERAAKATELLLERGFTDKRGEHPWNDPQCEKEFPSGHAITVWSRRGDEIRVDLAHGDTYDGFMLVIADTSDLEVMMKAVTLAEYIIGQIAELEAATTVESTT